MKKTRVLLADDHTLMRAGVRALLDAMADCEVVAEAGDGDEALELLRQHRPDVALMDIDMKRMSGLEAMATAKREFPHLLGKYKQHFAGNNAYLRGDYPARIKDRLSEINQRYGLKKQGQEADEWEQARQQMGEAAQLSLQF